MHQPSQPLRALLEGLVDYAGLFPPAALTMPAAAREYLASRTGADAWVLGRFVVPLARLPELAAAAGWSAAGQAWDLTVLLSEPAPALREQLEAFAQAHAPAAGRAGARLLSLETKVARPEDVEPARSAVPEGVEAYFELPLADEPAPWLAAVRAAGARAKVRTGGVQPEAIPPSALLARFLVRCAELRVPFKATAGLHHPLRAEHPLTYEPGSVRAVMHGYLNVFLAAALAWHGRIGQHETTELLDETDWKAFHLGNDELGWRQHTLSSEEIREARREFGVSYGSCSFREPVDDLRAREWL